MKKILKDVDQTKEKSAGSSKATENKQAEMKDKKSTKADPKKNAVKK